MLLCYNTKTKLSTQKIFEISVDNSKETCYIEPTTQNEKGECANDTANESVKKIAEFNALFLTLNEKKARRCAYRFEIAWLCPVSDVPTKRRSAPQSASGPARIGPQLAGKEWCLKITLYNICIIINAKTHKVNNNFEHSLDKTHYVRYYTHIVNNEGGEHHDNHADR